MALSRNCLKFILLLSFAMLSMWPTRTDGRWLYNYGNLFNPYDFSTYRTVEYHHRTDYPDNYWREYEGDRYHKGNHGRYDKYEHKHVKKYDRDHKDDRYDKDHGRYDKYDHDRYDKGWGYDDRYDKGWGYDDRHDKGWGYDDGYDKGWGYDDRYDNGWGYDGRYDDGWGDGDRNDKGWGKDDRNDKGWGDEDGDDARDARGNKDNGDREGEFANDNKDDEEDDKEEQAKGKRGEDASKPLYGKCFNDYDCPMTQCCQLLNDTYICVDLDEDTGACLRRRSCRYQQECPSGQCCIPVLTNSLAYSRNRNFGGYGAAYEKNTLVGECQPPGGMGDECQTLLLGATAENCPCREPLTCNIPAGENTGMCQS